MFYVGQKVVCVREEWAFSHLIPNLPKTGGVYTLRHKYCANGTSYLLLDEIVNPAGPMFVHEPAFICTHFRPIVERKTDISVFKRLLVPGAKILETTP